MPCVIVAIGLRSRVSRWPRSASWRSLSHGVRERVRRLEVAWSTGSTNTVLLSRPNPPGGSSEVMLAEYQTAGRGRRGRAWLAPPGGAVCMSMSWTFRDVPADLSALGLVIGVCEVRALHALGVTSAKLKWPNDLLVDERKLGGILIELRAESDGPALCGHRHRAECRFGGAVAREDSRDRHRRHRSRYGGFGGTVAEFGRGSARRLLYPGAAGVRAGRAAAFRRELAGRGRVAGQDGGCQGRCGGSDSRGWRAESTCTVRCWWRPPTKGSRSLFRGTCR